MANLEILCYPDSRLHLVAKEVLEVNDEIRQIIQDMISTMYEYNGIGLAATQVNIQKRIFIMDTSKNETKRTPKAYINPVITQKIGSAQYEEGCLSVPNVFETVTRASEIEFMYLDENGIKHTEHHEGLSAICIQHETDHLDGKVFVDYLSNLKQNFIKKKMKKLTKEK